MPDSPSVRNSATNSAPKTTDPESVAPDAEADDGPVSNAAKEIFAAALEKKKSAGQSRSAHLDGHGGVGGATASHKATRTFRRKSG